MRVAVIGSGVVGVTTAHALQRAGADVTVFDCHPEAALGASFANGGQLSYSYATPLGSPAILAQLPNILLGRSPGIGVSLSWRSAYWRWVFRFLRNCMPDRHRRNAAELSALAQQSAELMQDYHQQFGARYHYRKSGKLVFSAAKDNTADRLSAEDLRAVEPALQAWRLPPGSATFAADDEVGDAASFARHLLRGLCAEGATLRLGQAVSRLTRQGEAWYVDDRSSDAFDAVVVCAGNGAGELLRGRVPDGELLPVAGFSFTLPSGPDANCVSVTFADQRLVFSRLGDAVRIAGSAHIGQSLDTLRAAAQELLRVAQRIAPGCADYGGSPEPWIGYRPATANSLPKVGRGDEPGLFFNYGHGMLGWTLCAATAAIVAEQVCEASV